MLSLDRTTHERLSSAMSAAMQDRAARALASFESLEMPEESDESWRYAHYDVDLSEVSLAAEPGDPLPADTAVAGAVRAASGSAVVVDGHCVAAEGEGVTALRSAAQLPDVPGVPPSLDRFAAAHDAFGFDGALVEAGPGAVIGPVLIDLQAVTPDAASFPRIVAFAAEGASLSLVVHQRSPADLAALVVPRIEVRAAPAALVEVTVVQDWASNVTAVAQHRFTADRDAHVLMAEVGLGGSFARLHLTVDLVGRGSDARILGAYFGDEGQTLDYRYFMNHAAPNTTSDMFLKGAVAGEARSIFSGLIRIEEEGQGTNAHQTNRNLVLSDDAEAHSVPNLEILANDVRCGHGSAVGPLDEEQRYYLMSRGLSRSRADRLQVKGFFEDALSRFPIESLEPPLREAVMERYERVAAR